MTKMTIGLTGNMGMGKSTVAAMFKKLGGKVVSSDQIVHKLLSQEGSCRKKVIGLLGPEILTRGKIDRKKVAQMVFGNQTLLRKLETIIHPGVIREVKRKQVQYKLSRESGVLIFEVPLLFEAKMDKMMDKTIVVWANRNQQIDRLVDQKNFTRKEVVLRIKAQMPIAKKKRMADFVIDNRKGLGFARKQVKYVWDKLTSCNIKN